MKLFKPKTVAQITASFDAMKNQLADLRSRKLVEVDEIQVEIQKKLSDQEEARLEAERALRVFDKLAAILD